jgi:hypothetical protein
MIRTDPTSAGGDRVRDDFVDAEGVQPNACTDDVDDCVGSANFMEMHVSMALAVRLRLGVRLGRRRPPRRRHGPVDRGLSPRSGCGSLASRGTAARPPFRPEPGCLAPHPNWRVLR